MRYVFYNLLALAMVIFVTNAAFAEGYGNKSQRDAASSYSEMEPAAGDSMRQRNLNRNEVRSLQDTLTDRGYNIAVDGIMGPNTRAALRSFQRDQGLEATGQVNQETLAELDMDTTMNRDRTDNRNRNLNDRSRNFNDRDRNLNERDTDMNLDNSQEMYRENNGNRAGRQY